MKGLLNWWTISRSVIRGRTPKHIPIYWWTQLNDPRQKHRRDIQIRSGKNAPRCICAHALLIVAVSASSFAPFQQKSKIPIKFKDLCGMLSCARQQTYCGDIYDGNDRLPLRATGLSGWCTHWFWVWKLVRCHLRSNQVTSGPLTKSDNTEL